VKENLAVAIDIEGDLRQTGRLSLIQIGLESEAVFLFDVLKCPALLGEKSGLRILLAGIATKILHNCRNDVAALKGQFNIELAYVWDVQIAHAILKGKNRGLSWSVSTSSFRHMPAKAMSTIGQACGRRGPCRHCCR